MVLASLVYETGEVYSIVLFRNIKRVQRTPPPPGNKQTISTRSKGGGIENIHGFCCLSTHDVSIGIF